jgi:hypothetical protein
MAAVFVRDQLPLLRELVTSAKNLRQYKHQLNLANEIVIRGLLEIVLNLLDNEQFATILTRGEKVYFRTRKGLLRSLVKGGPVKSRLRLAKLGLPFLRRILAPAERYFQ